MKKRLEIVKTTSGEPVKAIYYLDNELSFINATEIKDEILSKQDRFEHLTIQANLDHLDLTGIQLLYSIRRTIETQNKKLSLNIKLEEGLSSLISRCGFNELIIR